MDPAVLPYVLAHRLGNFLTPAGDARAGEGLVADGSQSLSEKITNR